MPKQIQKPATAAPKQARPAPKKPVTDAHERPSQTQNAKLAKKDDVKSNAADKVNAEKTEDTSAAKFGELVSDVADNQSTEVKAAIELSVEPEVVAEQNADSAPVETSIRADELAAAKLVELNLNSSSEAAKEATNKPNTILADTKNTEQKPSDVVVKADITASNDQTKPNANAAPQAQTATVEVNASNDNLAIDEAIETLSALLNIGSDSEAADDTGNERVVNYLNKLIDRLEQLSPEVLEKAGLEPKNMEKIINHMERLVNLAENSDFDIDVEKLVSRLSHIFNQNQTPHPDHAKLDANNLINALAAVKPEPKQVDLAKGTIAENTKFDGQADNDNVALDTKAKHANANDKASQTAENASPKANGATRQAADTATNIEASKYADRYSKTANAQNVEAQSADEADKPADQTRSNAVYNNVKSAAASTQKASQMMSALDKISNKNPLDFLTQMQNGAANQALDPNSQDNIVNVKLAMQNGRLTQNPPLNSMAFQISKQFGKGNGEFQIKLDPAELGRINIKLSLKQGGNVKVHMVVERNDVFELLQRDARALEKALNDAGFDGNDVDVEFSLDQNDGNGSAFDDNFFNQSDEQNNGRKDGGTANETENEILEMVASHVPQQASSTGIDRKV